jgi:hypothetical protein
VVGLVSASRSRARRLERKAVTCGGSTARSS